MIFLSFAGLLASWLFSLQIVALDQDVNSQLVANLKLANTKNDWWSMLADSDFVYNFADNPVAANGAFKPGSVLNADVATFPILTGSGMTVTQLNLGPCAILPPHSHRAMNLVVATSGTTSTYMYPEDGNNHVIQTQLSPGMMTVFPQASFHTMVNEGCGNTQLYSFLNSEDAGRSTIPNILWQFGPDIFSAIFPFFNVSSDDWNSTRAQIPLVGTGAISGYDSCLQKCGLSGSGARRVIR